LFPNIVVTLSGRKRMDISSQRAAGKPDKAGEDQARGMWSIGWANRGGSEPEGSTVAPETGEKAKATGPASAIAVT